MNLTADIQLDIRDGSVIITEDDIQLCYQPGDAEHQQLLAQFESRIEGPCKGSILKLIRERKPQWRTPH